jgi:hypothetical protein
MPWKCPKCGSDPIADSTSCCDDCGYRRTRDGVVLRSEASGKQIEVRLSTTLGSPSLTRLDDPGIGFVSREQFRIERRVDEGNWVILPVPFVKNPTFIDGEALQESGRSIVDGMKLSINGRHFFLILSLI